MSDLTEAQYAYGLGQEDMRERIAVWCDGLASEAERTAQTYITRDPPCSERNAQDARTYRRIAALTRALSPNPSGIQKADAP